MTDTVTTTEALPIVTSLDNLDARTSTTIDLVNEAASEVNAFREAGMSAEARAILAAQEAGAYEAAEKEAADILTAAREKAALTLQKGKDAAKAKKDAVLAPFMDEATKAAENAKVNPIEASKAEKEYAALSSALDKALVKAGLDISQVEHFLVDVVSKKGTRVSFGTKTDKDYDPAVVRAWALDNGHEVGARGRIHDDVIDAYKQANASA